MGTSDEDPLNRVIGSARFGGEPDVFTLTPAAKGQSGAVMSDVRIDLTHDFTISFSAYFGSKDAGGDGIAFILQNDPWGADALGTGGGGKGAAGIANGLAISFDTYSSPGEPLADYTGILDTDGKGTTALTKPVPLPNLEDGQWHGVSITWDTGTQTLTYWVDGHQAGTISGDLATRYFGGSDYVYFGFTGATGGATNLQQIKLTNIDATYAPAPIMPPPAAPDFDLPQMTIAGAARFDGASEVFALTPNAKGQTGAVMSDARLDLTHDFTISFSAYLGNKDAGGDGITFVLQNDPWGADAIGGGGGSKGAVGIANGLAISLDTYSNPGELKSDYTAIVDTDAKGGAALTKPVALANIEDGQWHDVTVTWDAATKTLTYWVDGKQGGTISGDLAARYFGGSDYVHFGFTGATGGATNLQQVKLTNIDAIYAVGPVLPPPPASPNLDLPQMTIAGAARFDGASDVFTLTPEAKGQTGVVMSDARLDLAHDFTISFSAYLGNKDAGGDGITFVLQNDPWGADALGTGGGGKGAAGIANGLAISLDTYSNPGEPRSDYTAIIDTDGKGMLTKPVALANLEDGQWHDVTVTWDAATKTLTYWVDGKQGGTISGDLAARYFGGSDYVHFGFTGATGGATNLQQVKVTNIDAIYAAAPTPPPPETSHVDMPSLTLSGSARLDAVSHVFTLTSDAKGQTGSVMSDARIDLTHDFSVSFSAYLGNKDAGGDGITFVLQNDPRGADALGGGGGSKGAVGIANGLAISLDTYSNAGEPKSDYTSFFDTDAKGGAALTKPVTLSNLEDGQWHNVTVTWDAATKTLTYWVDGKQGGTISGDLAERYFGGSDYVHFGFTGATGGATNLQQVKVTNLSVTYAPGDTPPAPAEGGEWGDAFNWPIIGIHAILTPDGKVLTFGTNELGQQTGKYTYDVWDPATNTHYTLPNTTPTDIFCSACIIVPSTGEILISGGDARPLGYVNKGVADVNVYDFRDMSLSASSEGPMNFQRWYPTVIGLANGKVLIVGGCDINGKGVGTPELYTPGEGWKSLTGAYSTAIAQDWDYPRAWLASNGTIVMFDANSKATNPADVMIMDPSGNGTLIKVGDLPFTTKWQLPAVEFAPDKILILDDKGGAWIMDISGSKPTFQQTGSLGELREWANLLVLADGSVMASGGSAADNKLIDVHYDVQIWNPLTGVWTSGDNASVPRMYHSTTLLLPDATVLSLGGGAPGPETNTNGEIYTPSYLFNADGSLADRPSITDAPQSIEPRQGAFTITVDDASSITQLTFIKTGAVTHSLNMSPGFLNLSFTHGPGNTLIVDFPDNSNVLTPGNWMLFAFNDHGTPSVAATIFVDLGGELFYSDIDGYVTLSGSASYDAASEIFTLTPDTKGQAGAVMSDARIDLTHDFSLSFSAFLGTKDNGADGIAFVLHNDPWGGDAFGSGGGSKGAAGIANGLAIGLDTYSNPGEPASDFTNIFDTDAKGNTSVTQPVSLSNLEDGQWHDVNVTWDAGTQTLTYWVDGHQGGTISGDLADRYFGGSDFVYFGFTGSTGGASNLQQVKLTGIDAVYEPNVPSPLAGPTPSFSHGIITGGAGNDTLAAGSVNTTLIGGLGADTLIGGSGVDHFVYRLPTEGGDIIKEFNIAEDRLTFSASGFGGGLAAGHDLVDGVNFIAGTDPSPTSGVGTFLYNTETHDLLWDPDGSGHAEAVQIAHFDSSVNLHANHFEITA